MPLREGSSDKVVQENIQCILNKDGCGYDPPYKDPAREVYTPAQAAAIAYAKAGRRNNTGGKSSPSKKSKSSTPTDTKTKPKTSDTSPGADIKVPDGWKVQQPGGDTTSKKNQPPKKEEEELSPEADKQMLDEVMEGYKLKWGDSASLLSDAWDTYNPKQKKKFLQHAKKIKAEEQAKQSKEDKNTPPASAPTPAQAPAPSAQSTPAPSGGDTDADESEKMLQDLLDSPDVNDAYKKALKNQWQNSTPEEKKAIHDQYVKNIKPSTKPQAPQPQTPAGWKSKDDGWTAHVKPKFDDNGNITYQGKVYKPTKTLPGSTQPKLYSDEAGEPKFVVKEGGAEGQNNAEYAANQVYGILAPHLPTGAIKSRLIDGKLVNDFMPNSKTINDLSDDELDNYDVISKVRKSLAADALVANWDYAGLSNDNMMVDKQGRVLRIDSGGTFNYRAQGEQKDFDSAPMEMWTLRSSTQGKQFWLNAQEEDYENLWRDQVAYIGLEGDKLKKTIAASNLPSEVKQAFNNRVDILSIAAQEANNIAKRDGVSWKGVDQVMERAFRLSLQMNPQSPDWVDKVRNKIRNDLDKAFPQQAPKLDFNLPGNYNKYNETNYKNTVKAVDNQLNDPDAGYYGGDPDALKQISPEAKYALREYSGSLYQDLNSLVRGKTKSFSDNDVKFFNQIVDVMDESLDQIPDHPNVGMFYRMNKISNKYTDNVEALNNLRPGDTYVSKGYSSYTDDHEGDENGRNEILDSFYHGSTSKTNFITIYQGKNIKNIAPLSDIQSERESLMQRDKNLKVASIKEESIKDWPSISWGGNETMTGKIKVIYLTDAD